MNDQPNYASPGGGSGDVFTPGHRQQPNVNGQYPGPTHYQAPATQPGVGSTPAAYAPLAQQDTGMPVPVVKVLSVRGVEYAMMSIMLWFAAGSLVWLLLSLVNKFDDFQVLAYPAAQLTVTLPVFLALFFRLKKAELADAGLRLDPSRRRFTQITQVVAFLTCVFSTITYVYLLFAKLGGQDVTAIGKATANLAIVLAIAGGILTYYWFDEHRRMR